MPLISPHAAAALVSDLIALPDGSCPTISGSKITSLLLAGLFEDHEPEGRNRRLDLDEIADFGKSVRYVPSADAIDSLIYRVSVLPARPNPIYDTDGALVRPHMGVDYRLDTESSDFLGGFEMAWKISAENADRCADRGALLLASHKGFVHHGCVRTITDWFPVPGSTRKGFVTEPADADIVDFIGRGVWLDIPGGTESGILVDSRPGRS